MKKKLLIVLFFVVLFIITDCGKEEEKEKKEKTYTIGDTINAESFDYTITKVEFCKYLNTTLSSGDFLLPTEKAESSFYGTDGKVYQNTEGVAPDGKVFLAYELKLKYTGKSNVSRYLERLLTLKYDGDYTFYIASSYINYDNSWIFIDGTSVNHHKVSFEALEKNEYIVRGKFIVPEEVANNTDKSLTLVDTGLGSEIEIIIR